MHIVLYEPEIPANTGNIGRTCVATGTPLHLIEPLGFRLTDRYVKRSGMDYWEQLEVTRYVNWQDFLEKHPQARCFYATTKAGQSYTDVTYHADDFLVFGPESRGLPEAMLGQAPQQCVRIPMLDETRSLNLSNSVAVILYEALRQNGFAGLTEKGLLAAGDGERG